MEGTDSLLAGFVFGNLGAIFRSQVPVDESKLLLPLPVVNGEVLAASRVQLLDLHGQPNRALLCCHLP